MKTEKEIKELIKSNKIHLDLYRNELTLSQKARFEGEINALKWVLGEDK
ncbi:MAG: hypothetical protein ACE5J3_08720 [Methanosarcinales archaeon]